MRLSLFKNTPVWALPMLLALLMSTVAFGQQGRGTILGTVTDQSGAVVPGAQVVIANVNTNLNFNAVSNAEGAFSVNALIVGTYNVTVTKEGFKKYLRSGIVLEVDQKAQLNAVLETGAVSEVIEVAGSGTLVDTTTATLGKVIENRRVQELPLNGRNAFSLVLLSPAVQSGAGPSASGFGDRGTTVSLIRINGSPLASNLISVDGLSSTNPYIPDVSINPNVDSVQEFKVQSNAMSAEFGFTLGGVVNLVTKSGTNQYHGSLYEYFRNDALDANSWTNNRAGRKKPPLRYNQYGGAIGGPIRLPGLKVLPGYDGRDRSFFFYNYEGYQFITNSSGFMTMPTEAFRNGDFSQLKNAAGTVIKIYDPATTRANPNGNGFLRDQFPGNIIPANRIDPVSKNILKFYPLPNRTPDNLNNLQNNYFGAVSNKRNLNNHTMRFDHQVTAKNNFSARYVYYKQFTDQGTANLYPDPLIRTRNDPYRGHNIVLTDLHNFSPNVLHEFRIGVARQIFDFAVASAFQDWPQKLGLPAIVPGDSFPTINNGLTGFNVGTIGRRGGVVGQIFDSVTWVHGNHSTKIGTELRLTQANNLQRSAPSGNFNFPTTLTDNAAPIAGNRIDTGNGFATFLLGSVGSASVVRTLGESQTNKTFGGYINDDWRIRRRLSLSLGLRYDYQLYPYERNCGTSNFNPTAINPLNGLPGRTEFACKDYGRAFTENNKKDFAPRVGISWDVFGTQKTVVRTGFGIFYASLVGQSAEAFESTNGFASTNTPYNPPGGNNLLTAFQFNTGLPSASLFAAGAAFGPSLFAISNNAVLKEKNSPTMQSQQWNLSIQQQLPGGILVEAAYSANHGVHLLSGSYDLNTADPAKIREFGLAGRLGNLVANPFAGKVPGQFGGATITQAQALRPFPYVGTIQVRTPHQGNSNYHALLLSAEKRFSQGFSFLASYTWAKLIADSMYNPINFVGTEQGNVNGFQNMFNRRNERSEEASNVPHRFVLSALWELPVGKGRKLNVDNKFADAVLGGWQLNTITTIVAGTPLVIRGASNGLADRPNWVGSLDLPNGFTDASPQLGILWFNTGAFLNPALYTFGNTPSTISQFRNPGAIIFDASVFKSFQLTEKLKIQLRGEAFNAPNHVNLGFPGTTFTPDVNGVNRNTGLGRITSARDPRQFQLGLKLIF
jgi:hypothetical protein